MIAYHRKLPSISALSAFECAARYCNFTQAAKERLTSQPTISRHISQLEDYLGVRLFDRRRGQLVLTPAGRHLSHAVVIGFEEIHRAIQSIEMRSQERILSIGTSYEIAHLWLRPRYEDLQAHLGINTDIRIVSAEHEYHQNMYNEDIDLCITGAIPEGISSELLFEEEIFPVCSQATAMRYRDVLKGGSNEAVTEIPLLELSKTNLGWATWETWFQAHGLTYRDCYVSRRFSNYVYLLEAARAGMGLALGWRGLVELYVERGDLVAPLPDYLRTNSGFSAVIGRRCRNQKLAERAIAFLHSNI